ncbi:MAG: S66 peptidase family protein [Steroidobacteraceae bacterium]
MSDRPRYQGFRPLRRGARVAVVAPAGPFEREALQAGLAVLEQRYAVCLAPELFARQRYLAGSDAQRLAQLTSAVADPDIEAVFCARGGYGSMRLLPALEDLIPGPKPLVGFSDITALHAWLQRNGRISVHGPVLTQLGKLDPHTQRRLFALLEDAAPAAPLLATDTYVPGAAEGPLLGGTLAVFSRLLGTPYLPPLEGAVLLLEDVGEQPYRLDRMWTHLALAGVFRQVRGIVLGAFSGCEPRDADYTSAQVLRDLAAETGLPCAAGFPIGHGERNEPVPLGVWVRLDATARTLTFLHGATG